MSESDISGRVCVLLLTDYDGVLDKEIADDIEKRLRISAEEDISIHRPSMTTIESIIEDCALAIDRQSFTHVVIAGCHSAAANALAAGICEKTGLPLAHIRHIHLDTSGATKSAADVFDDAVVKDASARVVRACRAVLAVGDIETIEVPVSVDVVVLGDDECARVAAKEISSLGHSTRLITSIDEHHDVDGYELISNTSGTTISGSVGAFEIETTTGSNGSSKKRSFSCGAVIDTRSNPAFMSLEDTIAQLLPGSKDSSKIVTLDALKTVASALPRIPRQRTVAIILDLKQDEPKSSTAEACEAALAIQRTGVFQVHVLCKHLRVAAPAINELYDRAREAGVVFLKYDKAPKFSQSNSDDPERLTVRCTDAVLGVPVSLSCDIISVSPYGLADTISDEFINNLHFSPASTAVSGYFLAGPATGERYAPQAATEAASAALEAHKLLAPGKIRTELTTATVDEEKCAICLTCIRACPHEAMRIDAEKNIAENIAHLCQKCGICVGVCPARAITLPEYSEEVLLTLLG